MQSFHDRLRFLRERRGLNQIELATALGMKQSTYSTYENGIIPKLDTLINIATFYDVSLDYLVGLSNDPKPNRSDLSTALTRLSKHTPQSPTEEFFTNLIKAATLYFRTGAVCGKTPIEEFIKLTTAFTHMLQAAADDDLETVINSSKALQLSAYNLQQFPLQFTLHSKEA